MEDFVKDFIEWVESLPKQEVKHYAVFREDGSILGIYPDYECQDKTNKVEVDDSIVLSVYEGTTSLESYIVDVDSETVEFVEIKSLQKIDDILHRIIDKKWADIDQADIEVIYDRKNTELKITLNDKFKTKKLFWSGSTDMKFIISDYNDPNIFYDVISCTIDDIMHSPKIFKIDIPENYSIYTRRLFKTYLSEEV